MEYENMRVKKALPGDRGLRNYSQMRKAELVALLQNNPPPGQSRASAAPTPHTRPPPPSQQRCAAPAPQMSPSRASPRSTTWEPIDNRRPRKPTQQEMDIFEQQEMSKSRPQVKSKLNPISTGGRCFPHKFCLPVDNVFSFGSIATKFW